MSRLNRETVFSLSFPRRHVNPATFTPSCYFFIYNSYIQAATTASALFSENSFCVMLRRELERRETSVVSDCVCISAVIYFALVVAFYRGKWQPLRFLYFLCLDRQTWSRVMGETGCWRFELLYKCFCFVILINKPFRQLVKKSCFHASIQLFVA